MFLYLEEKDISILLYSNLSRTSPRLAGFLCLAWFSWLSIALNLKTFCVPVQLWFIPLFVGGWLNLPSFRIPVCQVSKDQVLCLNSICPLLILLLPISRFPEGRNRLTSLPTSLLHCRKEFPCASVSKSISRFPWRFPPSCKFKTIYQSSIRPTLLCCVHSSAFGLFFSLHLLVFNQSLTKFIVVSTLVTCTT